MRCQRSLGFQFPCPSQPSGCLIGSLLRPLHYVHQVIHVWLLSCHACDGSLWGLFEWSNRCMKGSRSYRGASWNLQVNPSGLPYASMDSRVGPKRGPVVTFCMEEGFQEASSICRFLPNGRISLPPALHLSSRATRRGPRRQKEDCS